MPLHYFDLEAAYVRITILWQTDFICHAYYYRNIINVGSEEGSEDRFVCVCMQESFHDIIIIYIRILIFFLGTLIITGRDRRCMILL